MNEASFSLRLSAAVQRTGTPLCVGIDPHPDRVGAGVSRAARFCHAVLDAADGQVPAVKPQFAFFEALGPAGMGLLAEVCAEARRRGLLVVGDAKRGDIGTTAAAYAAATLRPDAPFPCDALTLSPFLGPDTLLPFLQAADDFQRGVFVLLRTSNPGGATWQAPVQAALTAWIAAEARRRVDASGYSPVGVVVGATHPAELTEARGALPQSWLLVPGFGAQGGQAADVMGALDANGLGALIVSARAATLPDRPDPAWEADPAAWMRARIAATIAALRAAQAAT